MEIIGETEHGGLRKRADAPGAEVSITSVFRTGKIPIFSTTGWQPTCKCEADTRPCIILDPFAGSGTTGVVAVKAGRDFIGFDLNEKYCDMANDRITAASRGLTLKEARAGQKSLFTEAKA